MIVTQAAKIVQKSILKMKLICHFIENAINSISIVTLKSDLTGIHHSI